MNYDLTKFNMAGGMEEVIMIITIIIIIIINIRQASSADIIGGLDYELMQ